MPRVITAAAILVGLAIRLEQFLTRRALWLDEAEISLNIVHRGFAGLLRPLAHEQGAPVGWLWGQRAMVLAFGNNEYALRLVPLASGVAAMGCVVLLARRLVGDWGAAVAAVVSAASPSAIRYSSEIKQYSSDLFSCALLLLLAVRVLDAPTPRRLMAWAVVGALAVWLSHPAVLVLGATALVVVVGSVRDGRRLIAIGVAGAVWATSWLVLYFASLRSLAANSYLRAYWASALGPRPLTFGSGLAWVGRVGLSAFRDPGGFGRVTAVVAAVLTAGGLVRLARSGRARTAAILVVVLVAAVVAGLADLYPLRGRLALYLVPVVWLALAAVSRGVVALPLLAFALVAPVTASARLAVDPFHTPDTRAVMQYVAAHRSGSGGVWVQWPEVPVADFYATIVGVQPDHVINDGGLRGSGGCGGELPGTAAHGRRVWAIFGYRLSAAPPTERQQLVATLSRSAAIDDVVVRGGAAAYLFDFGLPGSAQPSRSLECLTVSPLPTITPTGLHTGPFGLGRRV